MALPSALLPFRRGFGRPVELQVLENPGTVLRSTVLRRAYWRLGLRELCGTNRACE
jgi:hypothetical protein